MQMHINPSPTDHYPTYIYYTYNIKVRGCYPIHKVLDCAKIDFYVVYTRTRHHI
jgi:hypothetical protein